MLKKKICGMLFLMLVLSMSVSMSMVSGSSVVKQGNVVHSYFFVSGDVEVDCGGLGHISYVKLGEHRYLVSFFCDRGFFRISGILVSPPLGGFGMDSHSWGFCKCFYGVCMLDGSIVDLGGSVFNLWGGFSWCRMVIET